MLKPITATLLTTACLVTASSGAQAATDGFAACMALKEEGGKKVFHAQPVQAERAKSAALGMQFGTYLREKGYAAKSMYADADAPPPALNVDCRWHSSADAAAAWTKQVVQGASAQGYSSMGVSFTPKS